MEDGWSRRPILLIMAESATPATLAIAGLAVLVTTFAAYKLMGSSNKNDEGGGKSMSSDESTKAEKPKTQIFLFFGSQTGTSEGICSALSSHFKSTGLVSEAVDLEDWDEDTHEEWSEKVCQPDTLSLFFMATYGEGEPTDNAQEFMKRLKDGDGFEGAKFGVFGLGNTQYEFYNAMGKLVDEKLESTGGSRVVDFGMGDDDKNLEEDYEQWREEKLLPAVAKMFGAATKNASGSKPTNEIKVSIPPSKDSSSTPAPSSKFLWDAVTCTVGKNRELLQDTLSNTNSTKHVEVTTTKGIKYFTADNAGVLPPNDPTVVKKMAARLNLKPSNSFSVSTSSGRIPFPSPCTVEEFLSFYCDLTTPPRRSELKNLANYCDAGLTKDTLAKFASKEGKEEYESKILLPYVGWGHLITEMCKDVDLSFEDVVNLLPRMQPRYYTISSSSKVHPKSIHMTVAVTKGVNGSTSKPYSGLCSSHIAESSKLRVFVKDSTFRLPDDSKPIIMVGPGTGFAPMRAFLQERVARKAKGRNILFFGCRREKEDFIYKDEIEAWESNKNVEVYKAFSREGKEKVYVQHLIGKEASLIKDLLSEGASIYICGGTRMGKDVVEAIKKVVGDDVVKKLSVDGRLVQELWA